LKIVRDRRDARWLPSRFHFALFRLYAYARLRAAKAEPVRGLILAVDREQSASENFLVAASVVLAATAYFAALFEESMSPAAAYLAGFPAAILTIQAVIAVGGLVVTIVLRAGVQAAAKVISAFLMLVMVVAGVIVATGDSSARYIAVGFLALVALNAIAAVLVFLLRNRIAGEERRHGVEP
jgi:hypothetical protein